MARFAANLSMMFNEVPFIQRFERAAKAGFKGVEYLFPYEENAQTIAQELAKHHLTQVLFNLPAGNWQAGDRGMASLPDRQEEFIQSVDIALEYAKALGCQQLHVMAGKFDDRFTPQQQQSCFINNIQYVADVMIKHDIRVLIEPINTRDMPNYFLTTQKQAEALLPLIARDNVFIQLDLYHCQIMEGDLVKTIERLWNKFSHIQIASVPYRHEPDSGEVNYPWIFSLLDEMGYQGWLGCEYHPAGQTEAGLQWLKQAQS
ncbi:TPA: hydroxypyruvate isomerase family protein [Proteus mirabilis]|nr:hydroxypyruvate isomerase family protein [Proteus mirabilis]HEK1717839.1 hydroxypyruvate isomerase family protein [Proteus mirabilis]HEK2723221.1 hydroxypyruvate isomerase family protein [Proteus mirabilis]